MSDFLSADFPGIYLLPLVLVILLLLWLLVYRRGGDGDVRRND